jgi:hypothetical protein
LALNILSGDGLFDDLFELVGVNTTTSDSNQGVDGEHIVCGCGGGEALSCGTFAWS